MRSLSRWNLSVWYELIETIQMWNSFLIFCQEKISQKNSDHNWNIVCNILKFSCSSNANTASFSVSAPVIQTLCRGLELTEKIKLPLNLHPEVRFVKKISWKFFCQEQKSIIFSSRVSAFATVKKSFSPIYLQYKTLKVDRRCWRNFTFQFPFAKTYQETS